MRFDRYGHSAFRDTARKRAAAERRQRREREALPLLADFIAAEQPSIDDVMTERAQRWAATEQAHRDRHAQVWRNNRRRLFSIPQPERAHVLAYWNAHKWFPGGAVHFSGFLGLYEEGQIEALTPSTKAEGR